MQKTRIEVAPTAIFLLLWVCRNGNRLTISCVSCALLVLGCAASAGAQYHPAWQATFDYTANDYGWSVAVDPSANVVVGGYGYAVGTSSPCIVLKYDSHGAPLWNREFSPFGCNNTTVATDDAGNIAVLTSAGLYNLDPDGNTRWTLPWSFPSGLGGLGMAVTGDGSTYIAGRLGPNPSKWDWVVYKYDRDGGLLWSDTYDGPAHSMDVAGVLRLDVIGNVYVTGESYRGALPVVAVTAKYSSDGAREWLVSRSFPNVSAAGCLVSPWGTDAVYIAAALLANGARQEEYDVAILKYDGSGNEKWAQVFDRTGALIGSSKYLDMKADGQGNVVLATDDGGATQGTEEWAIRSYAAADGSLLWDTRYASGSGGWPMAIATDALDRVFVTGAAPGSGGALSGVTLRLGPTGSIEWTGIDFPGSCAAIAFTASGGFVVTGNDVTGASASDIGTVQYAPTQTPITLVSFYAAAKDRAVLLTWETATEADTAGFHLWRADSEAGIYARITQALVPSQGDATHGAAYAFTDSNVTAGATYFYKLEDVDLEGRSTFHGPVSARVPLVSFGCGMASDSRTGTEPILILLLIGAGLTFRKARSKRE